MSLFKFTHEWASAGQDIPEIYYTMTNLALHVGDINLMQNEDVWAKTIRDAVLVSSYPLAMWLAASWWRLNFETLSASPSIDWRMAHEMGAANHGFVWPKVLFASDREFMQIWAAPSNANSQQSVRYLNGLDRAAFVKLTDFQRSVETFITSVLNRLDAVDCHNTDLWQLWQLIQEDRADLQRSNYRRLEAELGYDPDECSEIMMIKAQILEKQMGTETFSELAPIYGRVIGDSPLTAIEQIINSPGLIGKPELPLLEKNKSTRSEPWQRAVEVASELRESLNNREGVIDNKQLYALMGLSSTVVDAWKPTLNTRNNAAIAIPVKHKQFKFVPRKTHPDAKRFEIARLLGDYLLTKHSENQWLTCTDISTSRQKYQRAFAAEFLCPIDVLQDFLEGDYSESAIEDAAEHFQVSEKTVANLLINKGLCFSSFVSDYSETRLPYQLGS